MQSTNINMHPRTVVQEVLRVKAPHYDPILIQKKKDAIKERKEVKAQENHLPWLCWKNKEIQ